MTKRQKTTLTEMFYRSLMTEAMDKLLTSNHHHFLTDNGFSITHRNADGAHYQNNKRQKIQVHTHPTTGAVEGYTIHHKGGSEQGTSVGQLKSRYLRHFPEKSRVGSPGASAGIRRTVINAVAGDKAGPMWNMFADKLFGS